MSWDVVLQSADAGATPLGAAESVRALIASVAGMPDPAVLRRSRVRLEETTIVRSQRHGEERYELATFTEVRFDRATNWVSIVLAIAAIALAVVLARIIPVGWLSWTSAILLGILGLLFAISVRTDVLVLKGPDRSIVVPLVDLPGEIQDFKAVVNAAMEKIKAASP